MVLSYKYEDYWNLRLSDYTRHVNSIEKYIIHLKYIFSSKGEQNKLLTLTDKNVDRERVYYTRILGRISECQ